MLTATEARKKGVRACMEKIGFEFCLANEENSATAYGEDDGKMFCFVGINNNPRKDRNRDVLILSSAKGFPYHSSCNVDMNDGSVEYLDYVSYKSAAI
jgi:hypothetical protein